METNENILNEDELRHKIFHEVLALMDLHKSNCCSIDCDYSNGMNEAALYILNYHSSIIDGFEE